MTNKTCTVPVEALNLPRRTHDCGRPLPCPLHPYTLESSAEAKRSPSTPPSTTTATCRTCREWRDPAGQGLGSCSAVGEPAYATDSCEGHVPAAPSEGAPPAPEPIPFLADTQATHEERLAARRRVNPSPRAQETDTTDSEDADFAERLGAERQGPTKDKPAGGDGEGSRRGSP